MPDVADPPAIPKPPPNRPWLKPFTPQTASLAARKRHDAEKLRKRAESLALLAAAQDLELHAQDERLTLLAEQIARTRKTLNQDNLEPHHRAALLRALCELLDQQRIARGEPLPGSRRPAPESRTRAPAASLPDPIEPAPPSSTAPSAPLPEKLPGDVTP